MTGEQTLYRFYVFRYVLAILAEKDTKFPRIIDSDEIQKEISPLTRECLVGLMQEIVRCCRGWSCTTLSQHEFNVMWQFREPSLIQIADAVWRLSSGDDCKYVPIEKTQKETNND